MKPLSRRFGYLLVMIFGVMLVYGMLSLFHARQVGRDDRADLRQEITATRVDLSEQEQKTSILAKQLESLGQTPAVQPSTTLPPSNVRYVPVPGPMGTTGPIGPKAKNGIDGLNGKDGLNGQPGPAGKDGTNGKDGRGVKSVDCTDAGWVVTYTDGSTSNAGQCRAAAVTPTP